MNEDDYVIVFLVVVVKKQSDNFIYDNMKSRISPSKVLSGNIYNPVSSKGWCSRVHLRAASFKK